ncbi:MAG TPA: YdeI/OmpD-associated family protein [Pyrinomonadaceae bacterium]|nr:YdeI/OmpD-associated family protein [Chloracidobacterium sp.]MBK9439140.1 YdeI/OmpD-associated family protein [Chloracidobacterium sp.]HQX56179.1 YdeI/OmpD-associated family protein [Pyrinomonadaceae bacterium]HQY67912.1 YdeI/OmpD-associated family protein [Pyrinomonadaceae bacterium]
MPTTDPRIDAYIEKSQDFAKPVLTHLRALVHSACPDTTETIKWGMPSFGYKGILCGFAAFKQHCTFGFWKQSLMESDEFSDTKTAMGSFGRLTSLDDLPSDAVLKKLIKQAMKLNDDGTKAVKSKPASKALAVPEILLEALAKDERAAETFNNFPAGCRREYIQWITEAKTDATREKRVATTLEWLREGKRRNWKYEKC